uniref:Lipoprotein n=1 Tax=Dinoroseobacter phage vB_DshS_R26L TaxID=3161158 RepID=A0AAU7VGI1_9CAUD
MKKILLAAVAFLIPSMVIAQGNCAPRDMVVERLNEKYSETRQSIGLAANNAVVETWASLESGTWTITVTTANGMTCLVASGQAFETVTEELPVTEGDPT